MKFFAIFSAIVAVAMCASTTWTIQELSQALQNPATEPALVPLLEQALNELMFEAISGNPQPVTTVSTAVQELSLWTLQELSEAIQDPSTDPALMPYLEHALNDIMASLMSGGSMGSIIVATPVGLITPAAPVVAGETVTDTPTVSSPLVQIIVNVKSQAPAPTAVPEVPQPIPVNPVDVIAITPPEAIVSPVDVIAITPPEAIVNPVDVIAITPPEAIVNPVDVIAITPPEAIVNPVDVIAITPPEINPVNVIAIEAPEVNPIDLLSPLPVAPAPATDNVGPIV